MRIADTSFVIVDTETTGARAGDDRLIEVGAVRVMNGKIGETFQQLINPERHVPRRITRLTGISDGMVYKAPTVEAVMPLLADFLGDAVLVAHNLPFDRRFLDVAFEETGLSPFQGDALCTLRLARRLLPALPSKGLSKLTQHFGIEVRGRHRALGDATATAELLLILLDRLRTEFDVTTVGELLAFQRKRYRETRREPSHIKAIREETLPALPDRPGVYFMRDRRGRVIYVGKAKSLKSRVRSYFTGVGNHPPRTKKLLRDVRDVTWTETGTELAALLEESRLIKRNLPIHNRAQRRYRDYPFLRLDTTHAFPTLSWTPRIEHDGAEYYGPLGRRRQAEELVELIGRLFRLRECEDTVFDLGRPCLYHSMGRCPAPCVGGVGAQVYPAEVERVRRFLTGRDTEALEAVEEAMRQAAADLEFELAGWYRDQLRRLRRTMGRQRQLAGAIHDLNAVLVEPLAAGYRPEGGDGATAALSEGTWSSAADDQPAGAQLFLIRYGRLVQRLDVPRQLSGADLDRVEEALAEHFTPTAPPPERHERADVDEVRILANWMRTHADDTRQVRWGKNESAGAFGGRVMEAVRAVAPDTAAPVDEEEL